MMTAACSGQRSVHGVFATELACALLQANADGSPFTQPPSLLMQQQQQPTNHDTAAAAATAVHVQPVQNFLEAKLAAADSHTVAATDTNKRSPPQINTPQKNHSSCRILSDKGAATPRSSALHSLGEKDSLEFGKEHHTDTGTAIAPLDHVLKEGQLQTIKGSSVHADVARDSSGHMPEAGAHHKTGTPPSPCTLAAACISSHDVVREEQDGKRCKESSSPGDMVCASLHDVPADMIGKWGHVLDIVTPQSRLTNCFTKTYSRFAKVSFFLLPSMVAFCVHVDITCSMLVVSLSCKGHLFDSVESACRLILCMHLSELRYAL